MVPSRVILENSELDNRVEHAKVPETKMASKWPQLLDESGKYPKQKLSQLFVKKVASAFYIGFLPPR